MNNLNYKTMNKNFDIEKFMSLEGYDTEERKARRKGNKGINTQEFFTPWEIVKTMCEKIDDLTWADPNKTFLEPCFGSGQFVIGMLWYRMQHGIEPMDALRSIYGVELMPDNVRETKDRVLKMFDELEVEYDRNEALRTMDYNLVCSDFFLWNFNEWRPYTEKELKEKMKKSKKKAS